MAVFALAALGNTTKPWQSDATVALPGVFVPTLLCKFSLGSSTSFKFIVKMLETVTG